MRGGPAFAGRTAPRRLLVALAAASLIAGVAGGLVRLGIPLGIGAAPAVSHAALMIGGFLATVITLERALALGGIAPLGVPLATGLGALLLMTPGETTGRIVLLLAALLYVGVSLAVLRRQPAEHTLVLAIAALAWAIGNVCYVREGATGAAIPWWFAFLLLTVAGERLELSRMLARPPLARHLFRVITTAMLLAAAGGSSAGGPLGSPWTDAAFGVVALALAAWLAAFDVARRTVRTVGYARYAAMALLAGYGWLAIAGILWISLPLHAMLRDAALHALGVGFVVSMIFAHGPLIVPVVTKARIAFTPWLYAPLAFLHASLLLRVVGGQLDPALRAWGGAGNALAMLWFAATLVHGARLTAGAISAGRAEHV